MELDEFKKRKKEKFCQYKKPLLEKIPDQKYIYRVYLTLLYRFLNSLSEFS